ncbi:hypothetical protein NDU88_001351 [Pleurodeles waltl]|uniref:Reverse transcriptase domain-containing protein n=1 Tax=Pleurodeles waltl TaxID=8319 RepID=A0AAV7ND64_PLEWA|nr:hypothetical protein NDU88_001351 [Pleurodeles waltl]
MAMLDELVKAITQLKAGVVSSKELTTSLAERVSQLQDKVEKKEQSPTGVSWPGTSSQASGSNSTNISLNVPSAIPLAPPERFSGDPLKAQSFLVQVGLHFTCRPHNFPDALSKVAFLLSYLAGDAATWAIPLVHKNSPLLYNWRNFVSEFERVFDHRTVTQSADRELLDLRQGNQDLVSYLANFNRLVAETSWPEEKQAVLFYKGLKEELKDILAQIDPQPTDCQELINLVLRLDHRLAERKGKRNKIEKYSWRVHDNRDSRTPKERTPELMEIGTIRRPLTKDEKDLRRKMDNVFIVGGRVILPKIVQSNQRTSKVQFRRSQPMHQSILGATGNFVDVQLVRAWGIPCIEKKTPEIIQAVNGKLLTGGPVTLQTIPLSMICEDKNQRKKHKEKIILDVIHAPQYGIILGLPWLTHHNPEINWAERKIVFSSALCNEQCLQKIQVPKVCNSYIATAAEKEIQLPKQYSSYKDVFDEKGAETLPPHRSYDCQIDLAPGAILPNCRVYALSEHENQHLRKYLDQFLENGFIHPSKSPAASPLFFVPKANGELRTCIDYRALNKVTIKNKYPLPLIPVLLEQVKREKIYTKLDLRGAYHLVRMREGDEWKTAFKTRYGLFEYTVMPFGLCNAPAAFQYFLNDVLREYLDRFAIVYIDDILIYSDNENEHVQHVKKILAALRKHHLYCKLTKCGFHVTTVEFLGVILTPQVLTHPDANRPFIVETDASDVAIEAVLSQLNKDTGQLHPVAYMSRKLNEGEQNYVIAEKELLAIRDAFKEWRHHLLGAKYTVTVYTDHRNLQFMSSARLLTPRQLRWMLFFAEFDFVVTFRPGKDNRKADALSRQESTTLPAFQAARAIIAPDKVLCIIKTEDFFEEIRNSFTVEKWQTWAQADPKRSIKQGLPFHDARLFIPIIKLRKIVFRWLHVIPTAGPRYS